MQLNAYIFINTLGYYHSKFHYESGVAIVAIGMFTAYFFLCPGARRHTALDNISALCTRCRRRSIGLLLASPISERAHATSLSIWLPLSRARLTVKGLRLHDGIQASFYLNPVRTVLLLLYWGV